MFENGFVKSQFNNESFNQENDVLSDSKKNQINDFSSGYWLAIIIISITLGPTVFYLISNAFIITQGFFGFGEYAKVSANGINIIELKNVFLILLAVIATIITLFTPFKKIKSPLIYFAKDFGVKLEKIKQQQDPELKKQAIIATLVTSIILLIITSSYFFIIKNIVTINNGEVEGSIFSVLLKLVTIFIFLIFTSFVVNKFFEIDKENNINEDEKETKRNIWTIGLITGIISIIGLGNGLRDYINKKIDQNKNLQEIKNILGGDNGDGKIGNDIIKITK